jgi:hypothetical protein
LFSFSIDLEFTSKTAHVEAGVSVFITQEQHIDLGIVNTASRGKVTRAIQLKTYGRGNYDGPLRNITTDVPREWAGKKVTLTVEARDDETYQFSASLASRPRKGISIGSVDTRVVSGDTGRFTGKPSSLFAHIIYYYCRANQLYGYLGGSIRLARWP